jgi:hypothetical protein
LSFIISLLLHQDLQGKLKKNSLKVY